MTAPAVLASYGAASLSVLSCSDRRGDAGRGGCGPERQSAGGDSIDQGRLQFSGRFDPAAGFLFGVVFCLNIESIRQAIQSLSGTELFSPEVYFLTQLPAVLNWSEVGQVVALALSLALLATIYPSWRAARTDPVEMLRNE